MKCADYAVWQYNGVHLMHMSKLPLLKEGMHLRQSTRPYSIINTFGKEIIDFHPELYVSEGAYSNETSQFEISDVRPTNRSFQNNYKGLALKRLLKHMKANDIIIDLGCSNCEMLNSLPNDFIKIGVDISRDSLFKCTPNALDSNVNHMWVANAKELPVPNSSIDAVLCCDVLEHMLEPETLLNEIHRILKRGGIAFFSVPNLVSIGNRFSLLIGSGTGFQFAQLLKGRNPFVAISGPRFPDQRKHLRWFTSSSLARFLSTNNFQVLERIGIGPITSRLKLDNSLRTISHLIGIIAKP